MHALGCLFTLFLILFVTAFAFVRNIISLFLNGVRPKVQTGTSQKNQAHTGSSRQRSKQKANPASRGKIIGDDEGEYIEFEEIHDNK